MSTESASEAELPGEFPNGTPELTRLGKRLEILRIERGVSKQRLARHAGTSRQQLWRVMTGKSELTASLRERLSMALGVEPAALAPLVPGVGGSATAERSSGGIAALPPASPTLNEYLGDAARVADTLRTMPTGDGGRRLKRALLNAVEDLAVESGRSLPLDYSEIRRRVLAGEI